MPRKKQNAVTATALDSVLVTVEETVIEEQEKEHSELSTDLTTALELAEQEIARIDERSELAIQVVTQSIRTQAAVAKGQLLLDIREKYSHIPSFKPLLSSFAERLGVPASTISQWITAASAVGKHQDVFGRDFMMSQTVSSLRKLNGMPEQVQAAVLEDSQESGSLPPVAELEELSRTTSVKLIGAQEKLEAAYQKQQLAKDDFELAKADPDCGSQSEEYKHMYVSLRNANASVDTYKTQVEQLKADLIGEKAKAESAQKAQEKLNQEIESLKFDDTAAREQRIKRISATLTINIPQIISDLMKFTAEENLYMDSYKSAIRQQMVQLHAYLGENI